MPTFKSADLEMHYLVDDFTDPWNQAETILLLHGNAESSLAWFGWVPHLARRYRLVRPDRRGFGVQRRCRAIFRAGDSYHVALTNSEACAKATLEFIAQSEVK